MKAKPLIIIDSRHTLYDYRLKLTYKYNTMLESTFQEILKIADCLIIFAHKDVQKNEYFHQEFLNRFGKLNLQCLKLKISALSELKLNQEQISIVTHDFLNFRLPRNYDLFYFSNVTQNAIKKQHLEEQIYNSNQQFTHISHLHQVLFKKQSNTHLIGYYFYPKKINELFKHNYLKNSDKFTFIPLDLRYYNKVILSKVRVFFHKLLDVQKFTEINISKAEVELMLNNYNQFIKEFKVISIDNIEKLQQLINRDIQNQILDEMLKSEEFQTNHFQHQMEFKTPYQLNFDNTKPNQDIPQINFPIIVKTKSGALTVNCHIMAIVVNEQGLLKVLNAQEFKCDLIFQEIINHESMIYKIYNLGNDLIIQKRRSIPNVEINNFKFQEGFYIFDSQLDLYENVSKCLITVNEYKQFGEQFDQDLKSYFQIISKLIKKAFNIQLFGFDVVGDFKQMKFYIIDINHFPGYKNVINIFDQKMENIKQKFDLLLLENIQ